MKKNIITALIILLCCPVCFGAYDSAARSEQTIVTRDAKGNIIKTETCHYDWDGHLICKDFVPDTTPTQITPIYGKGGVREGAIVKVGNEYKIYNKYNQKIGRIPRN